MCGCWGGLLFGFWQKPWGEGFHLGRVVIWGFRDRGGDLFDGGSINHAWLRPQHSAHSMGRDKSGGLAELNSTVSLQKEVLRCDSTDGHRDVWQGWAGAWPWCPHTKS